MANPQSLQVHSRMAMATLKLVLSPLLTVNPPPPVSVESQQASLQELQSAVSLNFHLVSSFPTFVRPAASDALFNN